MTPGQPDTDYQICPACGSERTDVCQVIGHTYPIAKEIAERVARLIVAQGSQPRLLTVAQAAIYLGRTPKAMYTLKARGVLPTVRGDGRVMFDVRDLDKWIADNKE